MLMISFYYLPCRFGVSEKFYYTFSLLINYSLHIDDETMFQNKLDSAGNNILKYLVVNMLLRMFFVVNKALCI